MPHDHSTVHALSLLALGPATGLARHQLPPALFPDSGDVWAHLTAQDLVQERGFPGIDGPRLLPNAGGKAALDSALNWEDSTFEPRVAGWVANAWFAHHVLGFEVSLTRGWKQQPVVMVMADAPLVLPFPDGDMHAGPSRVHPLALAFLDHGELALTTDVAAARQLIGQLPGWFQALNLVVERAPSGDDVPRVALTLDTPRGRRTHAGVAAALPPGFAPAAPDGLALVRAFHAALAAGDFVTPAPIPDCAQFLLNAAYGNRKKAG